MRDKAVIFSRHRLACFEGVGKSGLQWLHGLQIAGMVAVSPGKLVGGS